MNLIIDIGNTSAKLAIFEHNKLKILERSSASKLLFSVKKLLNNYSEISKILVASVATIPDGLISNLSTQCEVLVLDRHFKMPFENLYKTPESLGIDRLALVAAAIDQYPKTNTLVIDAGTCITYDFVNAKAQYLGGAIAPGLNMRYTALHEHTANLPILNPSSVEHFIGTSTASSIHSGVVHGTIQEINGVISSYSSNYPELTVILTGGDANFLCKQFKISIFANSNFLLEGLNFLLEYKSN